uniref:Uncharacterized protein n=1 Tax=Hyaloperonospora arabidopsidis (strain Emoy2) TaxID=559515 RepID=M4B5W3_HYAAE
MSVAAKHRVSLKTASILKELGYAGNCSYHHFLYPSEKETKNILTWIVSKLPRFENEEFKEEGMKNEGFLDSMGRRTGSGQGDAVLDRGSLCDIFVSWKREKTLYMLPNKYIEGLRGFQRLPLQTSPLELPWKSSGKSTRTLFRDFPSESVKVTSLLEALAVEKCGATVLLREDGLGEEVETEGVDIRMCQRQAKDVQIGAGKSEHLALQATSIQISEADKTRLQTFGTGLSDVSRSSGASAQESAGEGAGKVNAFEIEELKAVDTSQAEQETSAGNEEKLAEDTQKHVSDTEHRLVAMQKVLRRKRGELYQIEQHILETQNRGQEMQKKLARHKQLLAMLPDAQVNIEKLNSICEINAKKKEEVAQQMEAARGALLNEYGEYRDRILSRKARRRQLIREMKTFQTEMLEFNGIIQSKSEYLQTLERVHERQIVKRDQREDGDGRAMTRSVYTSRIMDIIKQVLKQKQDITKILDDIKTLQKQLDAASEKQKRAGAMAEEKIYSAVSRSKSGNSTKAGAYEECYRKFAQVNELFEKLVLAVGNVGENENAARDLQNWIFQLEARGSSKHLDKVLADLESVRGENVLLQNELCARTSS